MKKPSQVLRETDVKQIRSALIAFNGSGEIVGKCALGVLACESGDPNLKLDHGRINIILFEILKAYGIKEIDDYPLLGFSKHPDEYNFDFKGKMSLIQIIVRLNDQMDFSFKEIADFLEVTFDL